MAETRSQGENPSPARVQDAPPAPTQPGSEGTMDTSDHQEATSTNPERGGTGFQGSTARKAARPLRRFPVLVVK